MNIILISLITPFKENVRGTSALAYHLLNGRLTTPNPSPEREGGTIIYSFNANKLSKRQIQDVETELGANIRILSLPRWYRWMFKFYLLFLRVFLKYPFVNYIKLPKKVVDEILEQKPDLIWVNSEELSRIPKQIPGIRRIQLGPDVESLYYYRMMGCRFVMNNVVDYWKCALMYRKYARLEQEFCTDSNYTYYAVGEEDIRHLRQLNPGVQCAFLRHPHYEVVERQKIHFHQPKIRLLIAGRYDLYMRQTADEVMNCLQSLPQTYREGGENDLRQCYQITFLGKGWEKHAEALKEAGFDVEHISFAPNYTEEIARHDIQLTPITIGTGTKGKVLDALANGLLVLGTHYALENIAVEHGKSCIQWEQASQVPGILLDIAQNREKYERMAAAGREAVLREHNPAAIAKQLFDMAHAD